MKKTLQILVCITATLCCSSVVVAQSANEYDKLVREAYSNGNYKKALEYCNEYCIEAITDNHPLDSKIKKCLEYKQEVEKAQAQDNHIDAYHFSKKIAEININDKATLNLIKDIAINHPEFAAEYRSQPTEDKEYNHLGELNYKAKKYNTAAGWFLKAAEMGNPEAQCNLGIYYLDIDNNRLEAEPYFRRSAAQKNPKAIYYLGLYEVKYNENYDKAISYFENAHILGFANATAILGSIYLDSETAKKFNKKEDKQKAIQLLTQAASAGSADAQYILGCMYYESNDKESGVELLKRAAVQEHENAKIYLKCIGIK